MASEAFSKLERELLAHSNWVRRLARSLVANDADAEELVQDAWVAALNRPAVPSTPLRPWLARVVRNLAARRWRRREVPLEAPAALRSATAGDLLDSAERLETQRILVEELQALPEPARRVILLRYFDGLDAAEIARRTGEAHGTVRWRLHEALAALRVRLDRRHGGTREKWMHALTFGSPTLVLPHAPHAAPPAASAPLVPSSVALSTGILAVNTFVKIVVAAVVVLALSVGVYVANQDAPVAPMLAADASVQAAPASAPVPNAVNEASLAEAPVTAERASIEAATPSPSTTPPVPATRNGVLVARAIDEQLRPLANAWLTPWSPADGAPETGKSVARSGLDGGLRLDVEATRDQTRFVAGCDGFATQWFSVKLVPDGTAYAGDMTFAPAGSVAGRVVDEHGAPVIGAEITVTTVGDGRSAGDLELMRVRGPEFEIGAPGSKSGEGGRFEVAGVPAGPARVWARAADTRWTVSAPIEVVAHRETRDVELALERDDPDAAKFGPIEGVVLAPDETPVKSPRITVLYSQGNWNTSSDVSGGTDGRFRVIPSGHGPHELTFSDEGSLFTPARLQDVAPGTHGLVVRLGQPKPVAIEVRSRGEVVTDFGITWREAGGRQDHEVTKTREHPDGRAVLNAPGMSFTFTVDALGYLPITKGPYDGRDPPREIEVVLQPVPGVHGRVLAKGQPVAGARVWLQGFARHLKVQVNEFELWVEPDERYATTSDAEGRFRLGLQQDGEFMLFAEADGWAKGELGPLELVASVEQKGLDVTLVAGGAIEGHVRMPPGRDPAGTIVGINHGEGNPRTQSVGPDGRFRFERLTPGAWKVSRCRSEYVGATSTVISSGDEVVGGTIDTNCIVVDGRTTRFDVDLRDETPCVLELELKIDGEPAKAWTATLSPQAAWTAALRPLGGFAVGSTLMQGATDAHGRARMEGEDPGSYQLRLVPAAEDATALEVRLSVDLVRGTTPLARDLKTGRVEGVISSWQEDSEHGWMYQSGDHADFLASCAIHADSTGHFVLPIVPAGPGRIMHDVATEPRTASFVDAASFTVEAGKTSAVAVP